MSDSESKEQQILFVMRKVLASIIKDVTPPAGMRSPLSPQTTEDVRNCLALISAREKELADAAGRESERPYYTDEPQNAAVVPVTSIGRSRKPDDKS